MFLCSSATTISFQRHTWNGLRNISSMAKRPYSVKSYERGGNWTLFLRQGSDSKSGFVKGSFRKHVDGSDGGKWLDTIIKTNRRAVLLWVCFISFCSSQRWHTIALLWWVSGQVCNSPIGPKPPAGDWCCEAKMGNLWPSGCCWTAAPISGKGYWELQPNNICTARLPTPLPFKNKVYTQVDYNHHHPELWPSHI